MEPVTPVTIPRIVSSAAQRMHAFVLGPARSDTFRRHYLPISATSRRRFAPAHHSTGRHRPVPKFARDDGRVRTEQPTCRQAHIGTTSPVIYRAHAAAQRAARLRCHDAVSRAPCPLIPAQRFTSIKLALARFHRNVSVAKCSVRPEVSHFRCPTPIWLRTAEQQSRKEWRFTLHEFPPEVVLKEREDPQKVFWRRRTKLSVYDHTEPVRLKEAVVMQNSQ